MPKLLAGKPDDYTIRVWVPGCSSGEECYSLAIALHECMEQLGRHFHVQIFGTDIDASAINLARAGLYPESILADVGPERIRRYFTKEDGGHYRVSAQIREMLVFAPQNVAQDPPFTKLDLLSCRNLLIYLGTELQRKLLPMFHYCLKADGILFLGSSETIGPYSGMFSVSHKKWKVFRRKPISQTAHSAMDFPIQPFSKPDLDLDVPEVVQRAEELSALQLVETILQQIDTPPSAIINEAGDIVYIHGRTGRFLEPAEGKISAKIVEMARPGLKKELADAIRDVSTTRQETIYKGLEVQNNEGKVFLTLTVKPILEQSNVRSLIMIVFEETSAPAKKEKSKVKPVRPIDVTKTIEELHRELQDSRESLQSTIEELETSNEELKSTNEELQSTNEESVTVNTELQSRIEDLSKATDDMKNLLDSTGIATIFLDSELRVRRFTPKATEIIPLTATDSGRPINHLATTLIDVDLAEQSLRVLDDLIVRQSDVMSRDGTSFTMRVRPYRTVANVIDGVVITLEDVSKSKQAGQLFQHLVEFAPVAMVIVDEQGEIVLANAVTETLFGYSREELLGRPVEMLIPAPLRRRHVSDRKAYMDEPQMRAMGAALDLHGLRKDGSEVRVEVSLRPITIDRKVLVASAIVDITERRQEEEMLTMLFELSSDPLVLIDMETAGIFEFNQSAHEQLGYTREEFSRLAIRDIEAVDSAGDFVRHIDRFDANGSDVFETKHRTKSDEIRDFRVNGRVVSMGLKKFLVSTWCDITPSDGN
ncbi:MAG: PAS domain S-box protein [Proteobacteria bacterium]|nr:PAS domain S-box protein [Pseudomonadota bacterium]